VTAEELGAAGAMTVLLKEALKPNLIQTLEGQSCLMHAGPFANIAHGNNSLIADQIALKLGDYIVTESGFGSDMGMEKFLDIVCRVGGLQPNAVVLVATVRALKHHGAVEDDPRVDRARSLAAIAIGAENLRRHLEIVREFGLPCVVAVNRRPGDTDEEVELVRTLALEHGAFAAEVNEGFERGGEGAAALAQAVAASEFRFMYEEGDSIEDKIRAIATRVYGARDVFFYPAAETKLGQYTAEGLDRLPICMAKTHLSLSADPTLLNAPEDFTLQVRDIRAYTGAGWLVPLCGDIQQMPGLGKKAAALNVDVDEDGRSVCSRLGLRESGGGARPARLGGPDARRGRRRGVVLRARRGARRDGGPRHTGARRGKRGDGAPPRARRRAQGARRFARGRGRRRIPRGDQPPARAPRGGALGGRRSSARDRGSGRGDGRARRGGLGGGEGSDPGRGGHRRADRRRRDPVRRPPDRAQPRWLARGPEARPCSRSGSPMSGFSSSIGSGNTIVVFLSTPIWRSVWR
jgi:hypothetical protein